MQNPLRLRLLGAFNLGDDESTSPIAPSKALAIVAYLSLARDRGCARQALTDLLWPNQGRERARSSLRQALFALRRTLGEQVILGDGEWIALDQSIVTDVEAFQNALKRGAMDEAVAAYGGAFIPDEGGIDSRPFERWVATERLRLQSAFLAAAHAQHRDLVDRGELGAAISVAMRLRNADPESDDAWHPLLGTLALANRYAEMEIEAGALRASRIASESEVDDSTEALLRRLRQQRAARPNAVSQDGDRPAVPVHPEFQGRDSLFRDLAVAWGRVQRGRAIAMVLEAAPGYGKTRVLQEIARRMRLERVRVVSVGASYREQDDDYAVLADLTLQLARLPGAAGISRASTTVLARLVPDLAERFNVTPDPVNHEPGELLRLRALAFVDLCGAIADESPLVLLVDDLQWADAASTQCLSRAVGKLAERPLLLVGASRGGTPLLGPTVPLLPLTADDVTALMDSIAAVDAPGWTPEQTAHLTQVCGGSPFRILQGLRSAIAGGALSVADDRWEVLYWDRCAALVNPAISMHDRFAALTDTERRVIATLGAIERPVTIAELEEALHLKAEDVVASLRRLDHEGFVTRATADAWSLTHALVAEEASLVLPIDLRQECAARLGHLLAKDLGDTARLRDAVQLLLEGTELLAALTVVERFLRTSRYRYDADTLATMVAGSRADAVFTRYIGELLARRRRRSALRAATRAAALMLTITGFTLGFRTWIATNGPDAPVVAPRPPALLPEGLRAYFPFDGSAENRIVPTASGTPISVRWVPDRAGIAGRAAGFDRSAYVELKPQVINDLPSGSLALWVQWDGGTGLQALTSKQRDNDNSWAILSINGAAGQGGQPTPGDAGRLYYHGSHEHMTGRANVLASRTVLVPARWYHVAVTWDPETVHLYVDGRLESSAACLRCDISANVMQDVIARVGDWLPDGAPHRFGGALDEMRVYGRVLREDEVRVLAHE